MNVDRMIEQQRAALLATKTGQSIACTVNIGRALTPGELARRRNQAAVRPHFNTSGRDIKDEA